MKILYISCLITEKERYDGERIKNTLIFDSLRKISELDVIDLSNYKLFNTFKIFWYGLFKKKKYDYVIISKDPHGANIIQRILNITKVNVSKIIYFEIGPFLYDRINNGSIKKETFINNKLIVVETNSMKKELEPLGFERIDVFPNFKPVYDIPFNEQIYPKDILRLVYLSRIEDKKGIYDLIDCLKELNKDKTRFILDVYGRPQEKADEEKINQLDKELDFVNYKGKINLDNEEAYKELSNYDLHVFPTKYAEGFPGTIIDFFISGVPTLASSFVRANDILTNKESIIYKQFDSKDLKDKLEYIYNNQSILIDLRKNSYSRRNEFSTQAFDKYLKNLLRSNN